MLWFPSVEHIIVFISLMAKKWWYDQQSWVYFTNTTVGRTKANKAMLFGFNLLQFVGLPRCVLYFSS